MKKITVVIPNYNGKHFLNPCLSSLQKQSMKEFDTIVVDNGSTDGSVELLEKEYPWVEVIKRDKNYGFCNAVNVGIKRSKTPYVLLLNNDTKVEKEFVKELMLEMEKSPKIFSCSSKMLHFTYHDRMDDAGDMYCIVGWQFQRGVARLEKNFQKTVDVFSSCAGAALYRKEVFEKIGYFDEGHFAYLEDMDIGYRARIYGYRNVFCPKARVYHVGSGTTGAKYSEFKVKLSARNTVYLNYKNMPVVQLVMNFVPLCIGYIIKWVFFIRKGYGKVYLEGVIEGIRTRKNCKRVLFQWRNFFHYVKIEWELFLNFFLYIYEFFMRRVER